VQADLVEASECRQHPEVEQASRASVEPGP
jgi:hypothetical protein